MASNDKLKQFVEKILSIQAPAQNLFGRGIPGMLGASGAANQAAGTSSGDVVEKLKHEAIILAKMQSPHSSVKDFTKRAETVEGLIRMAWTLSILTEAQANQLLRELSLIVSEPPPPN